MNTNNGDRDVLDNSAYNPFPEPQTIPSGWDLSSLPSTPQMDAETDADDAAES